MHMAKGKKKSAKQAVIPAHPALPHAKEIGELCGDVYRHAVMLARQQGLDEQTVEQASLRAIGEFTAACIKQSKADWKAYTKETGVHAAYVAAKQPAKRKKKTSA
jgi:hypothetical protein